MVKKLLALLFTSVLAFPLSTTVFAQDTMAKPAKQARWEGTIIRSSQDKSTLTVRKVGGSDERTVQYDSSTRKDGDRVICEGTWDKSGVLHATLISKRLSHSQ